MAVGGGEGLSWGFMGRGRRVRVGGALQMAVWERVFMMSMIWWLFERYQIGTENQIDAIDGQGRRMGHEDLYNKVDIFSF